jgi:hypothetical protein
MIRKARHTGRGGTEEASYQPRGPHDVHETNAIALDCVRHQVADGTSGERKEQLQQHRVRPAVLVLLGA